MTVNQKKIKRRVTMALIVFPFLIAFFIVGGIFVGSYLSNALNGPVRTVSPFVFATVGLVVSIIAIYFIAKKISNNQIEAVRRDVLLS